MDELLEIAKKKLFFQKLISALLAVIIVMLLAAGAMFANQIKQISGAVNDAVDKLQEIDVSGIEEAISGTQKMLESVDEFSSSVDKVTERVRDFDAWMSGIFGN